MEPSTTEFVQSFLVSHQDEITESRSASDCAPRMSPSRHGCCSSCPCFRSSFLKMAGLFSDFLLSTIHSRPQREFLENVLSDLNRMLAHFIRAS